MVNVAGQQWDLFDGWNGDMRVFSFIAPSPVNSFSADLMDFFDHLTQNNGFPADSQYLISKSSSRVVLGVIRMRSDISINHSQPVRH